MEKKDIWACGNWNGQNLFQNFRIRNGNENFHLWNLHEQEWLFQHMNISKQDTRNRKGGQINDKHLVNPIVYIEMRLTCIGIWLHVFWHGSWNLTQTQGSEQNKNWFWPDWLFLSFLLTAKLYSWRLCSALLKSNWLCYWNQDSFRLLHSWSVHV